MSAEVQIRPDKKMGMETKIEARVGFES